MLLHCCLSSLLSHIRCTLINTEETDLYIKFIYRASILFGHDPASRPAISPLPHPRSRIFVSKQMLTLYIHYLSFSFGGKNIIGVNYHCLAVTSAEHMAEETFPFVIPAFRPTYDQSVGIHCFQKFRLCCSIKMNAKYNVKRTLQSSAQDFFQWRDWLQLCWDFWVLCYNTVSYCMCR
jgi:hypothetical protein